MSDPSVPCAEEPVSTGFCPMPVVYIRGGDLECAFAHCRSNEERSLMEANITAMRGDPARGGKMAAKLLRETDDVRIQMGCGVILALDAMCSGSASAWREVVDTIQSLRVPEELEREREFIVASLNGGLHGRTYPKWLETGAFTGLAPELFPAARWIYVVILYIKWKEIDMLAVAEPMIAQCRLERSDFFEIYLRLLAATACSDHGEADRARNHLDAAIRIARTLGFLQPLIEYTRGLSPLMEERLKLLWPEAAAPIKKKSKLFLENWTKVYNAVWDVPMAEGLTPREFEACALVSRGMTVREVAGRMGISQSSVKKYLNTAYSKLCVDEKKDLYQLIHP